jgi:hypothetical protein
MIACLWSGEFCSISRSAAGLGAAGAHKLVANAGAGERRPFTQANAGRAAYELPAQIRSIAPWVSALGLHCVTRVNPLWCNHGCARIGGGASSLGRSRPRRSGRVTIPQAACCAPFRVAQASLSDGVVWGQPQCI